VQISKRIILLLVILFFPYLSGCAALLIIPGGALLGHTIQKSNEEYDNIIVNMGYKYKQYYEEMEDKNKEREIKGEQKEQVLTFEQWIETQAKTDKERKAIERYKKIHLNNP